jgi:catechol 2,3-dioxygenase-like lactoylglutathione lyase family enzyme
MNYELQLIQVPVSDVDASIEFYAETVGFNLDHDHQVSPELRFVQMTPPGSACSIAFGIGLGSSMAPGDVDGLQLVVEDIGTAHDELTGRGLEVGDVQDFPWGRFLFFSDPDGNGWAIQQPIVPGN